MERAKKPFTLIELLLVIAVIAILASMLLPALGQAKERAQGLRCLGQFKQCNLAILQYAGDNRGYRPAAYSPDAGLYWAGSLIQGGYISDKLTNSVLLCPTAPPAALDSSYNKCYGMMRDAPYRGQTETLSAQTAYRMDQSVFPSEDILIGDSLRTNPAPAGNQIYTVYKFYNTTTTFQLHMRHLNTLNASFYDGHAASLTLAKIKGLHTYNVPLAFGDYGVLANNTLPIVWSAP